MDTPRSENKRVLTISLGNLFNRPLRYLLGMAFLEAWAQLLLRSKVLFVGMAQLPAPSILNLFTSSVVILVSLIIMLAATRLTPLSHRRVILYVLAGIACIVTAGISMASAGLLHADLTTAFLVVAAISGVPLSLAWIEVFATQGMKGALVAYALSVILGYALGTLISFLPQMVAISATVVLPLFSTVTLRPFNSVQLIQYQEKRPRVLSLIHELPWQFVLVAGLVTFAYGAINTSHLPSNIYTSETQQWLLGISASFVAFLIAGAVVYLLFSRSITLVFYIALPVIVLASLLLNLPYLVLPVVLLSIITVGVDLIRLLVWLLLVASVANKRIPAIFSFSLLSTAQYGGNMLGQSASVFSGTNWSLISTTILVILVLSAIVVISARNLLAPDWLTRKAETTSLQRLATEYRLSSRETQIAQLWLSGHNSAFIEKALFISKSTVKTHLQHIYQKTDMRNKEELLALLESLDH